MTRSTPSCSSAASARVGEAAGTTRAPWIESRTSNAVRTASLSSTTSTVLRARVDCMGASPDMSAVYGEASDRTSGYRGGYPRGPAGGLPHRELADDPQCEDSTDEVIEIQARE